jgi:Leucine-rich repeat (LRR) protein
MTNSINLTFSIPELSRRLFVEATGGQPSKLLNYRRVSRQWETQCEKVLEKLWDRLQNKPPKGLVNIPYMMRQIGGDPEDDFLATKFKKLRGFDAGAPDNCFAVKFRRLADVFRMHGNKIPLDYTPVTVPQFQILQKQTYWIRALETIWHSQLRALIPDAANVPPLDAKGEEIHNFLMNPLHNDVLAQITELDLNCLNLKVLPPELNQLRGLRKLSLHNNGLTQLPKLTLPNLYKLDLSKNYLSEFPEFNLPNLEKLDLNNNRLSKIPPHFAIPYPNHLRSLDLSSNLLSEFPNFIFPHLETLRLFNNQLREVPRFAFEALQVLDLSSNQLTKVPTFILPTLRELHLDDNQLDRVPNFAFPNLEELFLSGNQLIKVPTFILPNLEVLFLNNNQLNEIPNFFLPQLKHLSLHHNRLSKVSNFILPNLESLSLNHNQLSQLPDITNLPHLSRFSFEENTFMLVPNQILHRFPTDSIVKLFISELSYPCQSSLAKLYQAIIRNDVSHDETKAIFHSLARKNKEIIFEMVWEIAGRPDTDSLQWGEDHAFDEDMMSYLGPAVRKAIMTKFERLSQEQRTQVSFDICNSNEQPPSCSCCKELLTKENLPRLADALSRFD